MVIKGRAVSLATTKFESWKLWSLSDNALAAQVGRSWCGSVDVGQQERLRECMRLIDGCLLSGWTGFVLCLLGHSTAASAAFQFHTTKVLLGFVCD